jgi:hypothetical protein
VLYELEAGVTHEMGDIVGRSGEEVVESDDFVTFREESITEMGCQEAGRACNKNSHLVKMGQPGGGDKGGNSYHFRHFAVRGILARKNQYPSM